MGIDELRWLAPVRPGDSLTARREITSVKRSASKPDRGVVKTRIDVTNQAGVTVMSMTTLTQMPARTIPAGD
jgi:acyl dehydratase